jgi:hypothetical protein
MGRERLGAKFFRRKGMSGARTHFIIQDFSKGAGVTILAVHFLGCAGLAAGESQ